jgi:hypothetical protein
MLCTISHYLRKFQCIDSQYWSASNNSAFDDAPVTPSRYKGKQQRSQDVRKASIERPHNTSTPRQLTLSVIDSGSSVNFACKSIQRLFERRSVFVGL